jgi:two-component system cell cycle response regulator
MTARVLVVDDIAANVKLLEARLAAEYFEVLTASSGRQAIDICERERIDVVLLDVMMPGMDGFEVCRRLKASAACHQVPVVMVTALDQPSDKIKGLEAGADDFLAKPVDDVALVTRVKNLARLKMLNDEMAMRSATSQQLGLKGGAGADPASQPGRILIIDDHHRTAVRTADALKKSHETTVIGEATAALQYLATADCDVIVLSASLASADALRICGQIRSLERTRHLPIVVIVEASEKVRLLRALDLGVNDYVVRPIDRNELLARVRTQVRRKRYTDCLRDTLEQTVAMSVTDALTGLHNRRYLESHLAAIIKEAATHVRPVSLLIADIDHFKRINDTYGHDAGDCVLKELACRIKRNTRAVDLACRLGGEEFVILMPETDRRRAGQVAERLRATIAADPFVLPGRSPIRVTASLGLASLNGAADTTEALFKRADEALYSAKREGRNRVMTAAA